MYTFPITTLPELEADYNIDPILETLISNGMNVPEFKELLKTSELRAIVGDEKTLGFFLCEPVERSVETHAFVWPQHRNRSKRILEAFKAYLTEDLGYDSIKTTVTGDFEPLVRFLKMMGFTITDVHLGVVTKGTGIFKATYLEYVKEI